VKVKGKFVPVIQLSTTPWRRTGGVEVWLHTFFDLGTRWRWVVSFTPLPLYPQGKNPFYPLDRRLGGPQIRSGRGGDAGTRNLDYLVRILALYHWANPAPILVHITSCNFEKTSSELRICIFKNFPWRKTWQDWTRLIKIEKIDPPISNALI
jgi:hypothetical protein